jgi:hypothetical protein
MVENGGGACKNPWQLAKGKRFPAGFCWLLQCDVYPADCHGPWRGKIPQADGGGRAAPDPGLRRRHSGVGAGFEPEGGYLVLLVADAQCEMVQGAAKDGVGAIIEQLKRRYVAVPPHEHRRCSGRSSGSFGGAQRRCCV